jgi:hypothetical protein
MVNTRNHLALLLMSVMEHEECIHRQGEDHTLADVDKLHEQKVKHDKLITYWTKIVNDYFEMVKGMEEAVAEALDSFAHKTY